MPVHFAKITVWCDHGMAAFIVNVSFSRIRSFGSSHQRSQWDTLCICFAQTRCFSTTTTQMFGKAHFGNTFPLPCYTNEAAVGSAYQKCQHYQSLFHTFTVSWSQTLQSERAVLRFQFVGENGGQYFEQSLIKLSLNSLVCRFHQFFYQRTIKNRVFSIRCGNTFRGW